MSFSKSRFNVLAASSTLGLTVLFAVAGQMLLSEDSLSPLYGLGLYGFAIVLFIFTLSRLETNSLPLIIGSPEISTSSPRFALWFTSLAFTVIAAQGTLSPQTPLLGWLLSVFWILGLVLYSLTVLSTSGWYARFNARQWWQTHWREIFLTSALGFMAFVIRIYDIELHPYSFINDEGEVGKEALNILSGGYTNFFYLAWGGQPIWSFVPPAITIQIFGNTAFAVRLISVVEGALTVSLLYLLGRELFGRTTGALAAGLLMALPLHVHFSRLAVNNVGDAFFATLTLWLTYRAVRRGTSTAYLFAGLITGLAFYTYVGSRLVIIIALFSLFYISLWKRDFLSKHFKALLTFAGALLVVVLPQAVYFWSVPNLFLGRLNTEGILNNGFLQSQAIETGQGYAGVLLDQFSKSILVYVARNASTAFFHSPQPYIPFWGAIFFGLGLGFTIWRVRDPRYMTLFVWFWSVVILGSTLTVGAPSNQRLLMSIPAFALIVALGLQKFVEALVESGLLKPNIGLILSSLVVVATALQGIWFYFGDYRSGHYFEIPGNELPYEVRTYTATLNQKYRMYLLGDPRVYIAFASFDFFAPNLEKQDFNTVTAESIDALPRNKGAFFVAIPERRNDLENIMLRIPGGQWISVQRRYQPLEALYYAYLITPEQFSQR